MSRHGGAVATALGVVLLATNARAAGPLGENGDPIRTSRYAIDLGAGPVLSGTRATGLGGAYVAVAEGVDGNAENAAAPAVRPAWSVGHLEWDFGVGAAFPAMISGGDFFNTGRERTDLTRSDQSEFATLGGSGVLQLGRWGFGLSAGLQRYGLRRRDVRGVGVSEELMRGQVSIVRAQLARAVDDGQLAAGIGFAVTALDVTSKGEVLTRDGNVFTTRGVAFDGGLLWRPNGRPFRLGLAVHAPVVTRVDSSSLASSAEDYVVGRDASDPDALFLPRHVARSWRTSVGGALQIGPRPLNLRFVDPWERLKELRAWVERRADARSGRLDRTLADLEAERDEAWLEHEKLRLRRLLERRVESLPRRYLLLSAALHAEGPVAEGVGVESFIQGIVDRSGEHTTFSPHLGIETELFPDLLQARVGNYVEPSRFRAGGARAHWTLGADLRLFRWSLLGLADERAAWRFGAAVDLSRDYLGWGVSVAAWH